MDLCETRPFADEQWVEAPPPEAPMQAWVREVGYRGGPPFLILKPQKPLIQWGNFWQNVRFLENQTPDLYFGTWVYFLRKLWGENWIIPASHSKTRIGFNDGQSLWEIPAPSHPPPLCLNRCPPVRIYKQISLLNVKNLKELGLCCQFENVGYVWASNEHRISKCTTYNALLHSKNAKLMRLWQQNYDKYLISWLSNS